MNTRQQVMIGKSFPESVTSNSKVRYENTKPVNLQ